MTLRVSFLLVLAVLSAGSFASCSKVPDTPSHQATATQPILTPEAAKQALLARMNSDRLFGFKADDWARVEVGESHEGWHDFGGNFRVNPGARKYTAWYGPPPEVRACTFYFEGTFSLREGTWVADDPVEVRSALGGGT